MVIKRTIQSNIERSLFKGKVIIIYGARQVGKTTLVKEILKSNPHESEYYNCDEIDIRQALVDKTSTELKAFFGNKKLVILDEAQRIKNIGLTLKIIADNFPELQIIATGSSSFDLSNEIAEPLTGRKIEFYLYPFSLEEIRTIYSDLELARLLERRIIYGMYPEIVLNEGEAERNLKNLALSYTYKDILQYQSIKNPEILEKPFIIFRLRPFSRNLRNELKKMRKIYFYDTGIRNVLINNLNSLDLRQDTDSLWGNLIISERIKKNNNFDFSKNVYFWRNRQGQEIDYLEEGAGKLEGFEVKWKDDKFKKPKTFLEHYSGSSVSLINKENFGKFV